MLKISVGPDLQFDEIIGIFKATDSNNTLKPSYLDTR